MTILVGQIFKGTCDESLLKNFHRVLQILESDDLVVMIEIPDGPRKNEGAKQNNYYVKGFVKKRLSDLLAWRAQRLIEETNINWPPLWNMSDDDIRAEYPPRKWQSESPMIQSRNRKWEMISPVIHAYETSPLIDLTVIEKNAGIRALEVGVSKGQMLDAIHRYFAYGCIKNALISNYAACGAPAKPRIANRTKLGRKNAATLVGNVSLEGKKLTEEDRQNLRDGWLMYVRPGTTVVEAYRATMTAFYNTGYSLKNGYYAADLLNAELRPTEREFRYHGPLAEVDGSATATRRIMGEGEWLKNKRELVGSARDGVNAFGQVCSIDASPIDVNLVSCFDALRPIGVGRALVVTDIYSDLNVGWHVGIGGVGANEANLAILCAALDKRDELARYGLNNLPLADFPSVFSSRNLSDNGELRCKQGISENVDKLGSKIEFVPSRRPDKNPVSESGHHSRNSGLNHHLIGTTKGKQRKRGEPLAITKALLSHYQYMRLLILWIHWRNTKQRVPQLLTTEMRRDKVNPTRIDMYRWAKQKGYVAGKPVDPILLKSHLLPTFTASVKRNGLVLHRPNKGNAVELLHQANFNDDYLATSGIIRDAMNGGKKHIEVKVNPDDLSRVYLFDKYGSHEIRNTTNDSLLIVEGCISDLGVLNDVDKEVNIETASQQDQDVVDMRSFRVEEQASAIRNKKRILSKTGVRANQKTDRSSVRENQAAEKRERLNNSLNRASAGNDAKVPDEIPRTITLPSITPLEDKVDVQPKTNDINSFRLARLRNFHAQRKS
ncbi:MAG: hypothetical protein B7Y56_09740 [Gallionellales bacterium 35-53-114]|jgi:hypothetical protein|nr:MAG: hypothetical protein B7Y56_09740 [Gallionellales bacterium 35-53-114]OYZ62899.1 MAG: hypothetical protein B7Y04_13595 [Gallionellales bacterium 24-53-125]OZB09976.1 MAG: hypothetical protein B7X61_05495 [Gallionellales bacterium 39-52-133]HQS58351.1 hypothetical protein [Gallionellaceae bacterium]HQS73906.1 hypothetical protein [Gallionellaceae bacterium]